MSEQTINVKETLLGLFEATDVPSDKQGEFASIFEAAVKVEAAVIAETAIEAEREILAEEKEELKVKMNEYSEYLVEEYATKLDEYLSYTTEKLFEDNKLAITNGVKASMFDSLIEGIKKVVSEHGIVIAEDKIDVVKELEEANAELEDELNETKHQIIQLKKELAATAKTSAIAEATKDLAKTQQEKVAILAREIGFDESFGSKLQSIVEAVSVKQSTATETDSGKTEFVAEGTVTTQPEQKRIKSYIRALGQ